ncbi:MAG: nicotinate phosphoribosyltransferase [Burkholderiales bacterium]
MNPLASPLLTDLYQLTMLHAYHVHRMNEEAVFELFVRRLPPGRNFLVAAGLEQALTFLEQLRFTDEEIAWVRGSGLFGEGFAESLQNLRFTGDVHAMPEGTVFFADEPILRVTAPLPEAQLVETRLINLVQFQSMIASKAARTVLAAPDKVLVDFGLRRAHGAEAGLLAARAVYLAGFAGTATVLAAPLFGIPVFGTMAHSFIQAHDDECDAFARFAEVYPKGATLLIDTYDTEQAAHKVVALAKSLAQRGIRIGGVRLDSGDLAALSRSVRAILDAGGLRAAKLFVSGNLDEERVDALFRSGAPIDGYGVGTSLVTSSDAPSLDAVYKLQEYAGKPRRKRSASKATWPGRKQVFRHYDGAGRIHHDVVSLEDDAQSGTPLLTQVMAHGRRIGTQDSLAQARSRAARELDRLPPSLRVLALADPAFRVEIAPALRALAREVDAITGEVPALCR